MAELRLIVGLGNPGREYEYSRHNLGYLVVGRLAEAYKLKFSRSSAMNSLTAAGNIEGIPCRVLKPLTFMNNSGVAVKQAMVKKAIEPENILVVCDDVNLGFGRMRIRAKGSDGGHNGLASVIQKLTTKNFSRLRLGVGNPKVKEDLVDYVLGDFNRREKKELESLVPQAVDCCVLWLKGGVHKAMDQFNKRMAV